MNNILAIKAENTSSVFNGKNIATIKTKFLLIWKYCTADKQIYSFNFWTV